MNDSIAKIWQNKKNILLTTHTLADADAVGSVLALEEHFKQQGKNVFCFIDGGIPAHLSFLLADPDASDHYRELGDKLNLADLLICLDVADLSRTKIPAEQVSQPVVNIDHHISNTNFGDYQLIEPDTASTAQIIFKILKDEEAQISKLQATRLLAGLMGDTGCFKHDNTSAKVFRDAAELVKHGGNPQIVFQNIFAWRSNKQFKAWGEILSGAMFDQKNKAVVAVLTKAKLKKYGCQEEDFSGLANLLQTCREADYAALLIERENGEIKGSLRSDSKKDFDVSEVAAKLGGGGHKYASGFVVKGRIIKKGEEILIDNLKI